MQKKVPRGTFVDIYVGHPAAMSEIEAISWPLLLPDITHFRWKDGGL